MNGSLLVYLAACSLLAGCAIFRDAPPAPVPPERIENRAYQIPELGDAHVTIERDDSSYASGCDFPVLVEGILLAKIEPSEWLDLYLKPGTYTVGTTQGCGHDKVVEIEIQVQAGEEKKYQLGTRSLWGGVGYVVITPVSQSNKNK